MKDAKEFYRTLGIISLIIFGLLLVRLLLISEFDVFRILRGMFWPLVAVFAGIKLLQRESFRFRFHEAMFLILSLYCLFYFIYNSVSIALGDLGADLPIFLTLNLALNAMGALGLLCYIYL